MQPIEITRRAFSGGLLVLAGAAVSGCGRAADPMAVSGEGTASPAKLQSAMTVYRDPSCGCCEAWAEIAENAGYQVSVIDHPDMPAIKKQHGVPEELGSCHTAIIAGYAIEGHVPLEAVARLLDTKPAGIKGLAVPGMPRGSPGMEMPDGSKDAFTVLAFDGAGRSRPFNV